MLTMCDRWLIQAQDSLAFLKSQQTPFVICEQQTQQRWKLTTLSNQLDDIEGSIDTLLSIAKRQFFHAELFGATIWNARAQQQKIVGEEERLNRGKGFLSAIQMTLSRNPVANAHVKQFLDEWCDQEVLWKEAKCRTQA